MRDYLDFASAYNILTEALNNLKLEIVLFGAAFTLLTFSVTFSAVKKVKNAIKRIKMINISH